jgi:hypothetical protein
MADVQKKANLVLIVGPPGAGKSTTGVKLIADKAGLTTPPFVQKYTGNFDYTKNHHIFANLHLRGMKYMYLPLQKLIEFMNTTVNGLPINHPDAIPLIGYGDYIYDEGSQGANARESMSSDTMVIQNVVTQSRKRHLRIIFISQDVMLLTWEIRKLANTWIECERSDPNSSKITVNIKREGFPKHSFNYNGAGTWKFFNSDELHPLSDARLAKAYSRAVAGG